MLGGIAGFVAARWLRSGAPPTPEMAIDEAQRIRATLTGESGAQLDAAAARADAGMSPDEVERSRPVRIGPFRFWPWEDPAADDPEQAPAEAVPLPTVLSTRIRPRWASMIVRQADRPSPVPPLPLASGTIPGSMS